MRRDAVTEAFKSDAERMASFLVNRGELTHWAWRHDAVLAASSLRPGQALVRHARFALTANNITYAKLGDAI